jgi:hypothetical protein
VEELEKEGLLFQQGKRFGQWKSNYYYLKDNSLFYSSEKDKGKSVKVKIIS